MLRILAAGAVVVALLAVTPVVEAAGWRQGRSLQQPTARRVGSQAVDPRFQNYHRGAYPKYIGGFNSRELQNIGVPSGDVGLRGNGINMLPW